MLCLLYLLWTRKTLQVISWLDHNCLQALRICCALCRSCFCCDQGFVFKYVRMELGVQTKHVSIHTDQPRPTFSDQVRLTLNETKSSAINAEQIMDACIRLRHDQTKRGNFCYRMDNFWSLSPQNNIEWLAIYWRFLLCSRQTREREYNCTSVLRVICCLLSCWFSWQIACAELFSVSTSWSQKGRWLIQYKPNTSHDILSHQVVTKCRQLYNNHACTKEQAAHKRHLYWWT